jgi:HEPN domain-containing protein
LPKVSPLAATSPPFDLVARCLPPVAAYDSRMKRLAAISKKIVTGYRPNAIVLLESGDRDAGAKTHLDLVILKETSQSPLQRRTEAESFLGEEAPAVDVTVYTSDEVRYLYSINSPFIHRIMREGKVLYMKNGSRLWTEDARDEFNAARVLYEHGLYRAACYHCLQAIEKGLHAMIMSKAKSPQSAEDIVELYHRAKDLGFKTGLSVEDVVFVGSFNKLRYPVEEALLPHFRPSREDAERAIDSARRLIEKLPAIKAK